MSQSLAELNRAFGRPPHVRFVASPLGGTVAAIETAGSRATISLIGAQVLDWVPTGSSPVQWLSPLARLNTGKAIRGGVPVCWPWFGPSSDRSLPSHGFVRTRDWTMVDVTANDNSARLTFEVQAAPPASPVWSGDAMARLSVTVGTTLCLELETLNMGPEPLLITEALHSYFHVSDISTVEIEGLDGVYYLDQLAGQARVMQHGPVSISGEIDRLYDDRRASCTIVDRSMGRKIHIAKEGSGTTVIWNPWAEKSARLGDMAPGDYRHMLCVETANAGAARILIEPGARHRIVAEISVEQL